MDAARLKAVHEARPRSCPESERAINRFEGSSGHAVRARARGACRRILPGCAWSWREMPQAIWDANFVQQLQGRRAPGFCKLGRELGEEILKPGPAKYGQHRCGMLALHHGLMYQPARQVYEATFAKHPFVGASLEAHVTLKDVKGLIFVIMDM